MSEFCHLHLGEVLLSVLQGVAIAVPGHQVLTLGQPVLEARDLLQEGRPLRATASQEGHLPAELGEEEEDE